MMRGLPVYLGKQKVGLIEARAIRRDLRKLLGKQTPSLATINRILQTHGLMSTPTVASPTYVPKPLRWTEPCMRWIECCIPVP